MSNLKNRRIAAGLSQRKLSEYSGVRIKNIQKYERGENDINRAQSMTLYQLSKVLNCRMEELLELDCK